jgi:hypothetical protein
LELGHIATARADALLEGFDTLELRHDAGIDGETPGLVIDQIAMTPEPFKSMRHEDGAEFNLQFKDDSNVLLQLAAPAHLLSDAKLNATGRDFCQIWCD